MASPDNSDCFTNTQPFASGERGTRHVEEATSEATVAPSKSDDDEIATPEKTHTLTESAKKAFHLHQIRATGPSSFFHPTNVHMHVKWHHNDPEGDHSDPKELALLWRSRDNRKGRNSIAIPSRKSHAPLKSRAMIKLSECGRNILAMCTTFPYWNMAFWSGWSYSIGSILFVIDGAWSWGPIAFPGTDFSGEAEYGVPLCFFFGAIFYQIGATMAYLEAINDGSFQGSALKRLLEGHEQDQKEMLDAKLHAFFGHMVPHHKSKEVAIDPEAGWKTKDLHQRPGSMYSVGDRRGGIDHGPAEEGEVSEYLTWRWWPTWHALRTHHIFEIGYVACTIQLFGATLYGMTGIVVLPGILDSLKPWQELGAYWVPQVVASMCFLTAGIMFTLETQEKWYKSEAKTIGWWIGAWATIGSVGFL